MRGEEPIEEQVRCECDGNIIYVPRKVFSLFVLRVPFADKKFIRYKEGAIMYSMSEREFNTLAHAAGAVHKYGKMSLVKVATVDEYLEYFKEV